MSAQLFDIEKIIAPLEGKPCGGSAKYEPDYETLELAIAKQEGVTPQPVDWAQVLLLSQKLLETKSKDLLLACYLCFALYDRNGYAGLASGFKVCGTLAKNFWEDLYPEKKRMRARIAAIEWLATKLARVLDLRRAVSADAPAIAESIAALEELDKFITQQLGREAPNFSKVARALRDHASDLAKNITQPVVASTDPAASTGDSAAAPARTPTVPATPAATTSTAPTQVGSEQDASKALRQCQATVRAAAAFFRSQKLEDPRAYRLARTGAWLLFDSVPTHKEKVTQIVAVPGIALSTTQKYDTYLSEQKYTVLILEAEESFAKSPYWLTAQRYTATAMQQLGPSYAHARQVVVDELRMFLRRMPELIDLKFSDKTLFADDPTRSWLAQEVLSGAVAPAAVPASAALPATTIAAAPGEEAPWNTAMLEAKQLAASGKTNEALALFQNGATQSESQRARFCWNLALARICYDLGLLQAAIPQLEFLEQQSTRYALEEWEPLLSLEVARVLLVCYAQLAEKNKKLKEVFAPKAEQLYARICRLDLNAALKTELNAFH